MNSESYQSSASLIEVKHDPAILIRTESLVSEALSFYSLDGEQSSRPSAASSPKSPRSSEYQDVEKDTLSNITVTPTLAYQNPDIEDLSGEVKYSISRSVSSTSFISATSEQEDYGLVNLHMQSRRKEHIEKEKSLNLQDKIVTNDSKVSDNKSKPQGQPFQSVSTTFLKSVSSSIQGSLHLPKVNIMILQASVVKEICAFSALDNVKDITCVSLLALGIQETNFKFHKTSQSKKNCASPFSKQQNTF